MKKSTKWAIALTIVMLALIYAITGKERATMKIYWECSENARKCGSPISGQIECHNECKVGDNQRLQELADSFCANGEQKYRDFKPVSENRQRSSWFNWFGIFR